MTRSRRDFLITLGSGAVLAPAALSSWGCGEAPGSRAGAPDEGLGPAGLDAGGGAAAAVDAAARDRGLVDGLIDDGRAEAGALDGLPADAAAPDSAAPAVTGALGAGPRSGHPWLTGQWVNGGPDRLKTFEAWRGMASDCVTQSIGGMSYWYQHAGCDAEAQVDKELVQSKAAFAPTLGGVFKNKGWKAHIWGGYPAKEHRKRLIHLCWMDLLPKAAGNNNGQNPRAWYDVAMGSGDKYMFLLGRKFAYLDAKDPTPLSALTFDPAYEFTLVKHSCWPGGYYKDPEDGKLKPAWLAFRVGFLRLVKAFRWGYAFQAGAPCPYRVCWRPQVMFKVVDINGQKVRHEAMFPNDAASWSVKSPHVVGGVTVLPAGMLGQQIDLIAVSWHDAAQPQVSGTSPKAKGSNWSAHLSGTASFWGLDEMAAFARKKKVMVCLPEWSARRDKFPPASPHPGDCYRLIHHWISGCLDVFAYDNVFDQGSGAFSPAWAPAQPSNQEPAAVYRALWKKKQTP